MTLETKHFAMSLKSLGEDGTIEGYGSIFGNIDSGNDIVLPGAFTKSLAAGRKPKMLWQHKTDMPIGVYDIVTEDQKGLYLKGRLLLDTDMGRNAYSLLKAGAIDGLSIGYAVRDYAIDKKNNCRMLKELELFEVSLVTFPMNEKASVTAVKSASGDIDTAVSLLTAAAAMCEAGEMNADASASCCQLINAALALLDEQEGGEDMPTEADGAYGTPEEKRALEKYLCDAGLSRQKAKAFISGGMKELTVPRDADARLDDQLAGAMERLAQSLKQLAI